MAVSVLLDFCSLSVKHFLLNIQLTSLYNNVYCFPVCCAPITWSEGKKNKIEIGLKTSVLKI